MSFDLSTNRLLRTHAWINGAWVSGADEQSFAVYDPSTQEKLVDVAQMTAVETEQAIQAAHDALPAWQNLLARERARILKKWYGLILTHRNDLAQILVMEQGKPYSEARGEISYGASFIEWFAEEGLRVKGDLLPSFSKGKRVLVQKQAIGVVAAITPWNFPHAMITRKCAPALMAGCTVLLKPSEESPLSALALMVLAEMAGFPKGVINVLPCDRMHAKEVANVMCKDTRVKKITFTGSTLVGKQLMAQAAQSVKKVSLELGGNAPLIVFEDADIKKAIRGIMLSKFRNTGQTCVCSNRILVHVDVYEEVISLLTHKIKALKIGPGYKNGIDLGPLTRTPAVDQIKVWVTDAIEQGARLCLGDLDNPHVLGAQFMEPILLADVQPEMMITHQEIFGPVVVLIPFTNEAEAVQMANDTPYGLASYFYTQNLSRTWRVSSALDYGMVGVNDTGLSHASIPFGGFKESGIGKEGSYMGLEEYLESKYILMDES